MLILTEIVAQYQKDYLQKLDDELKYYNKENFDLKTCIEKATKSLDKDGKKLPHQHRLGIDTLAEMAEKLVELENDISLMIDFDKLYNLIKDKKIKGFGLLAIYDTALRIGYYLGIFPTYVYIHAGTKKGAKNLLEISRKKTIILKDLPAELQILSHYHIEHLLCLYKDGELHKDKHKVC